MTTLFSRSILKQLNILILVVNQYGEVEYVGPSVKTLLGYEPESLLGEGWWELTRRNERERLTNKTEIVNILQGKEIIKPVSFERALTAHDGTTKWIVWNISYNDNNTLIGIGHDITTRKRAENLLQEKNKELQLKNTEIGQSIQYAKRIQEAITQEPGMLNMLFEDAFVLYKPRDIVSGDFYWYYKKGNKVFTAVADCTGHGVPGAMMSVIANGLVHEVIVKKGIEEPGKILTAIDAELTARLSKADGTVATADGMDIALTIFDFDTNTVSYAGAFRPLVMVRNNEIIEYRGSRYPIGFYEDVVKTFDTHTIPLQQGDRIYLFSDGYVDQFGCEEHKKLNRKRFYELLLNIQTMKMEEQKAYLEYAFMNWKQDEIQTDDILVVGLEI